MSNNSSMSHIEQTNPANMESDEISLKELILKLKEVWKLFIRNIKTILLVSLIGGALGLVYAWMSKPVYEAKMTFVMRAESNNMLSSLSGLSSLLGGGTSAASASPMDRIIELLGSDRIVGEALLSKAVVDGKNDVLANHLIRIQKFDKDWEDDTLLSKASFTDKDVYTTLSLSQRKAIKVLTLFVAGKKGILSKSFDKKSGIITMNVKYHHESFSIALSNVLYGYLVDFYSKEAVSTISSKVEVLQNKVDSIRNALGATQSASARQADQGLGILLQQDRVQQKNLGVRESILTVMFAEAQKNLEQLSFIQATTSPSFSIIDQPYSPIKPETKSKILFTLVGMFLFGVFTFGFIIVRRWFRSLV